MKDKYILGIIPARGGSKRFPGKNIKMLNGRPLIDYIIRTGLEINKLNKLIVSTDSIEILKVAARSGAEIPFLRPKELGLDTTTGIEVMCHAILEIEKQLGHFLDIVVYLQPTSPFTTVETINQCIELLLEKEFDTVLTVTVPSKRCEWIGQIDDGRFNRIIDPDLAQKLSQGDQYSPSGNVYVSKRESIIGSNDIIGANTGAILVDMEEAVDIDYQLDIEFAEFLLQKRTL